MNDRLPAGLTFGMLLNLASVANADRPGGALGLHRPLRAGHDARDLAAPGGAGRRTRSPTTATSCAPTRQLPRATAPGAGGTARSCTTGWPAPDAEADAEAIQYELYEIGKRHGFANLRDWFKALYEVLLGQSEGPRFGTFVAIYGIAETRTLIEARAGTRGRSRMTERRPTPRRRPSRARAGSPGASPAWTRRAERRRRRAANPAAAAARTRGGSRWTCWTACSGRTTDRSTRPSRAIRS